MLRLLFSLACVMLLAAAAIAAPRYVKPVCTADQGSGFGHSVDPFTGKVAFHSGLDLKVAAGSPVVAAASGRVTLAERRGPYGLVVEIDHGGRNRTRYAHLGWLAVESSRQIEQGETVGWSGATGRTQAPALHFEIWRNDVVQDPQKHLHPNPRCARP